MHSTDTVLPMLSVYSHARASDLLSTGLAASITSRRRPGSLQPAAAHSARSACVHGGNGVARVRAHGHAEAERQPRGERAHAAQDAPATSQGSVRMRGRRNRYVLSGHGVLARVLKRGCQEFMVTLGLRVRVGECVVDEK
jgi:hypothetical protein